MTISYNDDTIQSLAPPSLALEIGSTGPSRLGQVGETFQGLPPVRRVFHTLSLSARTLEIMLVDLPFDHKKTNEKQKFWGLPSSQTFSALRP